MMKLSQIHTNPKNPRLIKDDRFKKLVKSIQEFPKMMKLRPIIIDSDSMILGGNMRFKALKELGYKEVPDEWIKRDGELTDEEKQRFIITDNVPFGDWDLDLLKEWDKAELLEWGIELLDWSKGHEVNNMTDEDVDLTESFDPMGEAKNLVKIIFMFDNNIQAKQFYEKYKIPYEYKIMNGGTGGDSKVWQINLSKNYGK